MQEMQETQVWSLGSEDPLEEGTATQLSILVRRIPSTEEPGGLWSIRSHRRTQLQQSGAHIYKMIYMFAGSGIRIILDHFCLYFIWKCSKILYLWVVQWLKTPQSQRRGPRLDPWSQNYIPHAATEDCSFRLQLKMTRLNILHATMKIKDPACYN